MQQQESQLQYHEKDGERGVWTVKCDIALPCATQNELDIEDAKQLASKRMLSMFVRVLTCLQLLKLQIFTG